MNSAQRNYSTIEKELLSVVETLRKFRTMLLGAEVHVYMDHRNLTYANLNAERIIQSRLYVKEYHPTHTATTTLSPTFSPGCHFWKGRALLALALSVAAISLLLKVVPYRM
jgi:hypothetical protein